MPKLHCVVSAVEARCLFVFVFMSEVAFVIAVESKKNVSCNFDVFCL